MDRDWVSNMITGPMLRSVTVCTEMTVFFIMHSVPLSVLRRSSSDFLSSSNASYVAWTVVKCRFTLQVLRTATVQWHITQPLRSTRNADTPYWRYDSPLPFSHRRRCIAIAAMQRQLGVSLRIATLSTFRFKATKVSALTCLFSCKKFSQSVSVLIQIIIPLALTSILDMEELCQSLSKGLFWEEKIDYFLQ